MTFDEACSYEIIQKKISLGKNPVDEFRNSAQYSNREIYIYFLMDVNNLEKSCLQKQILFTVK